MANAFALDRPSIINTVKKIYRQASHLSSGCVLDFLFQPLVLVMSMNQQQIQALTDAVRSNPDLQSKLSAVTSFEEAAKLASEAGFPISPDELKQNIESGTVELTDSELEFVAGGGWGKLINSIRNGGESCGNAVQKLTCNIIEKLEK